MADIMVDEDELHLGVQTNLQSCVGSEITLFLLNGEDLEPLKLPLEKDGSLRCRLVGADRQGAWVEPTRWLEQAREEGGEVAHIFLRWENVLSIFKRYACEQAIARKQYRGLRPR
ncbi:MAG: hypothetical protein HY319_06860 [Armatimonadetes bacterium]|nr:hypothetical protein [Armatimonadota bacterium]